jgi:RNA polymerase sigma-70 factor (ECF subfamily)
MAYAGVTRSAIIVMMAASHDSSPSMSGSDPSPLERMARNDSRWRGYLDAMQSGQTEALAQLYDETSSIVFGLALRILRNSQDAEEVVLDVYQQIWTSRRIYDAARGTVWAWLATLTRSRAIDRLRSGGSRRARELPLEIGWEPPSSDAIPEEESIFREERKLVRDALESLAPEQRQAIELSYFRGLTHVEVAERLGAPLGTIKTRIRGGMRRLREALAPEGTI